MESFFSRFFGFSELDTAGKKYITAMSTILAVNVLIIDGLILIISLIFGWSFTAGSAGLGLVLIVAWLWAIRRGFTVLASLLIPTLALILIIWPIYTGKPIESAAILSITIIMILTSFLLGKHGPILFGLLSILMLIGGYLVGLPEAISARYRLSANSELVNISLVILLLGIILRLLVGRLFESLQRLEQSERNLREKNKRLLEIQASLEEEIRERKMTQEALRQARDEALEAGQLKTELMARVSHEFRTPLGAIAGYAQLLQQGTYGPLADKQERPIKDIIYSASYLTNLVNEFLDQAQFEAGQVKLVIKPFEVQEMFSQVTTQMTILAQGKGLTLRSDLAPDVPELILGDRHRIQQIMVNLLSNAIKFTEQGSVEVRLYCPTPGIWAIEVTDTGPGISEEAQQYIFEPFRQEDGSLTRRHGGTGLGLSIVKHLVTLMGGEVSLNTKVGQGSQFMVSFPLKFED